jgi:hypothetical protein
MARAGITGRTQLRRNLLAFNKSVKTTVRNDAVENALNAAILAKNTGQNTIATTPSDLSVEPKNNRIWTGQMFEDFVADVDQRGPTITVKFGWIKRKQKYYDIQEHGGTVPTRRGNIQVSAMHALTNALVAVQRDLNNKGMK